MTTLEDQRLFFAGAGSMAEAIIKGLLQAHLVPPQHITVYNRNHPERLQELARLYGVRVSTDRDADIAAADCIVFAMKPYTIVEALAQLAPAISAHQLVISVVAGISTSLIECHLRQPTAVIRAMPNTSSFVQESATAVSRGRYVSDEQLESVRQIFASVGCAVIVDESLLDAVTGLSGSGPAYVYYMAEAMLKAGQSCGLSAQTSRELLVQTLYGAARMLQETEKDPAELRRNVTSPNGTTMAAIGVLDQAQVQDILVRAVQRATERAGEMGREAAAELQSLSR